MGFMGHTREKKMAKNAVLYFVGNFASKLLNIFLVPIYMTYLDADLFGTVDIMLSLSAMIAMLMSLDMTDAVYRYLADENDDKKRAEVITNAVFVYIVGCVVFGTVYFPLLPLFTFRYALIFGLHVIIVQFGQFILQISRGMRENIHYAIGGIIVTFLQGITNIVLIVIFSFDASSILIAGIIGQVGLIVYITVATKWYRYLKRHMLDRGLIMDMVKYSWPLFVQVLLLWIVQCSGTYLMTYFSGNTIKSGIYGMANKFPTILYSLSSIFLLAWQESAIIVKDDRDAKEYYNKMYSWYFWALIIAVTFLLPVLKVYFCYFGKNSYGDVWIYVPILLFAAFLFCLAQFVGMHFTVTYSTINLVKSLFAPVLVTVIIDIFLVKRWEILAVTISQMIAFFLTLLVRKKQSGGLYKVDFRTKTSAVLLVMFGSSVIIYYVFGIILQLSFLGVVSLLYIFIFRKKVKLLCEYIKHKVRLVKHRN